MIHDLSEFGKNQYEKNSTLKIKFVKYIIFLCFKFFYSKLFFLFWIIPSITILLFIEAKLCIFAWGLIVRGWTTLRHKRKLVFEKFLQMKTIWTLFCCVFYIFSTQLRILQVDLYIFYSPVIKNAVNAPCCSTLR